jgi:hypothetical protein
MGIFNLFFRRFVTGEVDVEGRRVSVSAVGWDADWKSAIRQVANLRYGSKCRDRRRSGIAVRAGM